MSNFKTKQYLTDFQNDNDEDYYSDILFYEEEQKYSDNIEIYYPKILLDFLQNTFYDSCNKANDLSITKFIVLYSTFIHYDININIDTPDWKIEKKGKYFLYEKEKNNYIKNVEAFITSDFGMLPNEIIAIIFIGRENYLKFIPL